MLKNALYAQAACIWEVMARKPGNVHRLRDFDDLTCTDFLLSAAAIYPAFALARQQRVGLTVKLAIGYTSHVVRTNTNLGIVLLLAPLAAVMPNEPLREGVERVLSGLDVEDARLVYRAIRQARPGGLGEVAEQDVSLEPTQTLREVMALAADRDLVARQYANGYAELFDFGLPTFKEGLRRTQDREQAIVLLHLHLMARYPDTLIARKRGAAEAEEAARRAAAVLAAGWPGEATAEAALADLDGWLCAEGHGRNPGATADLVTACLFAALREGVVSF